MTSTFNPSIVTVAIVLSVAAHVASFLVVLG